MRIIFNYTFWNLAKAMFIVMLGLCFAVWLSQSIKLIEFVIAGGAPFHFFVELLVLTLPGFLNLALPLGVLVAILFIYSKMLQYNEIIVMRAAGMSQLKLMMPGVAFALLFTCLAAALSIQLAPLAQKKMVKLQQAVKNEFSAFMVRDGVFTDISENLTVFVTEKNQKGELFGILMHDVSQPSKPVTILARYGKILQLESSKGQVLIYDGSRQEYDENTGKLSTLYFDKYKLDLDQYQSAIRDRWVDPKEKKLSELLLDMKNEANKFNKEKHIVELHKRFSLPLYVIGFGILGIYTLINGQFSRGGQRRVIAFTVLTASLIRAFGLMVDNICLKNMIFVPLLYLVPLLPLLYIIIDIYLFKNVEFQFFKRKVFAKMVRKTT